MYTPPTQFMQLAGWMTDRSHRHQMRHHFVTSKERVDRLTSVVSHLDEVYAITLWYPIQVKGGHLLCEVGCYHQQLTTDGHRTCLFVRVWYDGAA